MLNSCSLIAASFTDTNNNGTGLSSNPGTYCNGESEAFGYHYNVTVYFGDGTSAANNLSNTGTVTLAENAASCTFKVLATHAYTSTGSYTVSTTICDEGGAPCISTGGSSLSGVTVGVPPSHIPAGLLSALSVQYSDVTQARNYTLGLAEYLYRHGNSIENTNFTDTVHGTVLSFCATRNAGVGQCRAHVLSFTCTATHASIYVAYQQPYSTDSHTYEVQAFLPNDPANPYYSSNQSHTTNLSWFIVTMDNGAGSVITTTPPTPPLGKAVAIHC